MRSGCAAPAPRWSHFCAAQKCDHRSPIAISRVPCEWKGTRVPAVSRADHRWRRPTDDLGVGAELLGVCRVAALPTSSSSTPSSTASYPARPTSSRPTLARLEPRYKILTSSSRSSTARRPSGSARSARVPPRPPCLFRGAREARARESSGCRVRCRRAMQGARDRLVRARCIDRQRLRRLWTCRAGAADASVARALRAGAGTRARASDHVCRARASLARKSRVTGAARGSV